MALNPWTLSAGFDMIRLAESLFDQAIIPAKAIANALHIPVSTLHHVDFLLT